MMIDGRDVTLTVANLKPRLMGRLIRGRLAGDYDAGWLHMGVVTHVETAREEATRRSSVYVPGHANYSLVVTLKRQNGTSIGVFFRMLIWEVAE